MRILIAALLGALFVAGAAAQGGFPSRPITMVVGFAPGGGTDTAARRSSRPIALHSRCHMPSPEAATLMCPSAVR